MNRSKKGRLEQVLALLLAAVMCVSLAACAPAATGTAATTAAAAATTAAVVATTAAPEADGTTAAAETDATTAAANVGAGADSEHYVFSYSFVGADASKDYNADPVAKHFQDMFNFEWEVIPATWSDYIEKARVWISAEDMPDILFTNFDFKDYKSYVDQELLMRLPEDWKTTYPHMAETYANTMLGPALEEVVEGPTAVLPNITFFEKPTTPKIAPHYSLFFRKDWASALGFEIKDAYTLEEFEAMVEKFMTDGSGLPGVEGGNIDTWGLDTSRVSGTYLASQWADYGRFYKDDTGKYVWGPDDPRVFDLVQHMKEGIEKGIVSPNFASFQNEEQDPAFYAGQSFGIWTHGWVGPVYTNFEKFAQNTGLKPLDSIQEAVLTDPDGHHQEYEQLNFWACLYFSTQLDDAKFERILSLCDYVVTEEAQEYIRMGIEGTDYTRNADGSYTITREMNPDTGTFRDLTEIYPGKSPFHSFMILGDNFAMNDPAIPEEYHNVARTMYATKQKFGVDTGTIQDYNFETFFFDGPNYSRFNINIGNELVQLATQEGDLRANFDTWLADRHTLVDPVLEELNAAYGN